MCINDFLILSRAGLLLAGYHWPSKNPKSPWSALIFIHGLAEHSGQYESLIGFDNKNNFAITSMDLRD